MSLLGSWLHRYQKDVHKLWKEVIDNKYSTRDPNIFCTNVSGASQFFKGVMWAAKAAKIGFRWKVGSGRKIKFWEDTCLGSSSLAVQYWDLYFLVNEKICTIVDVWDGNELKCTFRRCFDRRLLILWEEVSQLASTVYLSDEEDSLVWQFTSKGTYTSQSLYKVINFRGVKPMFVPAVWKLNTPLGCIFSFGCCPKAKCLQETT
jgi:hypothetical protein